MGFYKEGNKRTAQIGHEIQLIESFLVHGVVIEVDYPDVDNNLQYPINDSRLDNFDDSRKTRVTNAENLKLNHLNFDIEVKKKGLNPEDYK